MSTIRLITWDSDPLTEHEIRTVEQSTGPLPRDYRQFLLMSNGGRTLDEVRFRFNELVHSDYLPLDSFAIVEPKFPPPVLCPLVHGKSRRLVQIAACDYSQYLLELTGPDSGSIYFWNYELEECWDAEEAGRPYLPSDDSLDLLAPSFTAFFRRLYQVPPDLPPNWNELEKTVENYAKYGDDCFPETERFFRKMTLAELIRAGQMMTNLLPSQSTTRQTGRNHEQANC